MIQILEFEKEIFKLENQIHEMVSLSHMYDSVGDITYEIVRLHKKVRHMKHDVYSNLKGWQKTQVARHPDRPYTLDYIKYMFTDFIELHGDRRGGYGPSIVGGLAKFDNSSVLVIGHQKGRDTKEKIKRNFGMSQPAGYRKALRLMKLAQKFRIPIINLIDTPGAYPGIDAEEKGQSEAIARNLIEIIEIDVPIIVTIIGEGGSGGALAIGVGDRILMLEHSVYSVISPEGCASILWGDKDKVSQAADALSMTAPSLINLGVIDEVVREPLGGAHRNWDAMFDTVKVELLNTFKELDSNTSDNYLKKRIKKVQATA